jgi:hypothetical protein
MCKNLIGNLLINNIHIYEMVCHQWLSPLTLWVRILLSRGVLDTTLCDKVCQWFAAGQWFTLGTSVSSTNEADRHDKTEILLKVALNIINSMLLFCYMYIDCHTVYRKEIFYVVCYVCYRIGGWGWGEGVGEDGGKLIQEQIYDVLEW